MKTFAPTETHPVGLRFFFFATTFSADEPTPAPRGRLGACRQRHTLYAHFPDERSLYMACSGLTMERDPLPDATPWRTIEDRHDRLRVGLVAVYGWYGRNADVAACVLRDAEYHSLTREIAEQRFGPYMGAYHEVLGAGLNLMQRAVLRLALSFFTWRTLVREGGLEQADAAEAMIQAIDCAGGA